MIHLYLSRLLGERRMTQAELSRTTGIRPNTISDIYRDSVDKISLEHLDRICDALDCPLSELLIHTPNRITDSKIHRDM